MQRKLFESYIYERGRNIVRQKMISNVKQIGASVYANVQGSEKYNVAIVYDENDASVLHMECDCPYAWGGRYCKHEAALYIYVKEHNLLDRITAVNQSLINQFNHYKKYNYNEPYIYNMLYREINIQLNKIGIIKTYATGRVDAVFNLIDQVLSLPFTNTFLKEELIRNIEERLDKWEGNKKYINDVISCCKKGMNKGQYLEYVNLMIYFCSSQDNIKDIILDILSSMKLKPEFNTLLLYALYGLIEDRDLRFILLKLDRYKNNNGYKCLYIRQLYNEGKEQQAADYIVEHKVSVPGLRVMLPLKEKIDYMTKNKEGYRSFVLEYFKDDSKYKDIHYIERLKELYENDWDNEKYAFFDILFNDMKVNSQKWILSHLNEYQYALKLILDDKSLTTFNRYASTVKKNDVKLYRYAYYEVLKEELYNCEMSTVDELYKCLDEIEKSDASKEEMLEIILSLQSIAKYSSTIFEMFEKYLKQKGFEDYVEIIEC